MTNVTCGLTAKKLRSSTCLLLIIEYDETALLYFSVITLCPSKMVKQAIVFGVIYVTVSVCPCNS